MGSPSVRAFRSDCYTANFCPCLSCFSSFDLENSKKNENIKFRLLSLARASWFCITLLSHLKWARRAWDARARAACSWLSPWTHTTCLPLPNLVSRKREDPGNEVALCLPWENDVHRRERLGTRFSPNLPALDTVIWCDPFNQNYQKFRIKTEWI